MSINTCTVSGHLGRAAELRATASGVEILNFTLAVDERVKNQQTGEWESRPNWIDCVLFGSRAGKIAQYMQKGTKACVSGRLRQSTWTDQSGQKRRKLEVIVDEIELMSRSEQQYAPVQQQYARPAVYEENVPF